MAYKLKVVRMPPDPEGVVEHYRIDLFNGSGGIDYAGPLCHITRRPETALVLVGGNQVKDPLIEPDTGPLTDQVLVELFIAHWGSPNLPGWYHVRDWELRLHPQASRPLAVIHNGGVNPGYRLGAQVWRTLESATEAIERQLGFGHSSPFRIRSP